jgi:peptidoglycan/xylan/chitin deacetylase (PgdA/CDA1 family)
VPLGNRGPIVTFSFDDFPRTALTNGASIVERFGGRATYYVTMGLMDTDNHLGEHFHCADLRSLIDRGHELASHTFSHLSAQRTDFKVFSQDVEHCEKAIRESIAVGPSKNFAYPYGEVTLAAKRKLGPRMRSCRGTCSGFNGPEVDLNLLHANSLYGDVDQAETAKQLILENESRRSWLIFYSHDVASEPSRFGCTPGLLEAVVSFAAERGARMMTVAEVVAELS